MLEAGGEGGRRNSGRGPNNTRFSHVDVFVPFITALSIFVCVSFVVGVLLGVEVSDVLPCRVHEK